MQFTRVTMHIFLASSLLVMNAFAQEKSDRETEIHKNVKLIEMNIQHSITEDIVKQYRQFIPILIESLTEITTDQSAACALTIRVTAGVKEIGAAKTKRPLARITAFRRNSQQEYLGNLNLYSYATEGIVNKGEIIQFLTKQLMEPVGDCSEVN
jgi:hypothetical protein